MTAVYDSAFAFTLMGLIWALAMGLAAGSYATNLIYRLPRHEPLFVRKPFCDACGAALTTRDLFPVVSWLLARGRCRHCAAPVPVLYPVVEAAVAALFALLYVEYNFGDEFILLAALGVAIVILAAIEWASGTLAKSALQGAFVTAIVYRTWQDVSVSGFAEGILFAGILGAALWRVQMRVRRAPVPFPDYAWWVVLAGACLKLPAFALWLVGVAVLCGAARAVATLARAKKTPPPGVASTALMLALLVYPAIVTHAEHLAAALWAAFSK